jgi:hypothetical protein
MFYRMYRFHSVLIIKKTTTHLLSDVQTSSFGAACVAVVGEYLGGTVSCEGLGVNKC